MPNKRIYITGGLLKGQAFMSPDTPATRPMSNKMKLAMNNSLGSLAGQVVLDAYGGSGALSFEAISHGAKEVVVLERDLRVYKVLTSNIKLLGLGSKITATRASVKHWLANNQRQFDLIIIDPPYDSVADAALGELVQRLSKDGQAVISCPLNYKLAKELSIGIYKTKSYGSASLRYYRAG